MDETQKPVNGNTANVGRGHPPKHSQFPKGKSGNPASRTMLPRLEQSRIASATIATGLTVGCMTRSLSRSLPKLFAPA
jgi:hypothetical protein